MIIRLIFLLLVLIPQLLSSQTTDSTVTIYSISVPDTTTNTDTNSNDIFNELMNSNSDTNKTNSSISIINLDEFGDNPDTNYVDELKAIEKATYDSIYNSIINAEENKSSEINSEPTYENVTNTESTDFNYSDYSTEPVEEETYSEFKPIIGIGYGVFKFKGEVTDNYNKNRLVGRVGKNISISRAINDYLDLNFRAIHGNLAGNERLADRNLNFQTEILAGGISVGYNFSHLIKKELPIKPFAKLGLEYYEYNSKGDLYDAQGNYYYHWSDGSLRNIPESSNNANNSIILQRDYVYETDLRDLNLDGLGKYQQLAIGLPIDLGFDFKVNKYVDVRIGHSWHLSFSDLIDNVSNDGSDIRKGTKGFDRFSYSYLTFRINLFGDAKSDTAYKYNDEDFIGLDGDEDLDGISDFADICAGTPAGVAVNEHGCPIDSDGDGIADYLDSEPNTPTGFYYIDKNGVGKSEADYEASLPTDTIAVEAKDVYAYYPSLKQGIKTFTSVYIEVPKKFKPFDLNKDSYISPDELQKAIDMFFDFDSNLTIDDIYELNDYFFNQGDEDEEW